MATQKKNTKAGQGQKKVQPKKSEAKATGIRTWLGFVLDKSGSMGNQRDAAISGFNEFLSEQKKVNDDTTLTVVLFDTQVSTLHDAKPLREVPEMTKADYVPSGMTALYDAIMKATTLIEQKMKPGERALITVFTDGQENSSVEMTKEKTFAMIKEHEGRGNWTFTIMGSHQSVWADAQGMGINAANVAKIDPVNVSGGIRAMAGATRAYRSSNFMSVSDTSGGGLYDASAVYLSDEDKAQLKANVKTK